MIFSVNSVIRRKIEESWQLLQKKYFKNKEKLGNEIIASGFVSDVSIAARCAISAERHLKQEIGQFKHKGRHNTKQAKK